MQYLKKSSRPAAFFLSSKTADVPGSLISQAFRESGALKHSLWSYPGSCYCDRKTRSAPACGYLRCQLIMSKFTDLFKGFFNSEKVAGLLLLLCTVLSLLLANSGAGESYTHLLHQEFGP